MTTPYSSIYQIFTNKISDYDLLSLSDTQIDSQLQPLLLSATIRFKGCRNDLTQTDNVNNQFLVTLTYEEQEILANIMVLGWLSPIINNTMVLKQTLTDKDFQMTSQANQLKELRSLRNNVDMEIKQLIRAYTYDNPSLLGKLVYTETYAPITDYGIGGIGQLNGNYGEQV